MSTTFDKYCYITCRKLPPFFEHKFRIAYSKVENAKSISDIEHPAVRAVIMEMGIDHGLEVHCDADLPARSGLGSSSSFVVGMLNSLSALQGKRVSKEWLAHEAIRIEQQVLEENVGSQDQVAAAHGGFNVIYFQQDGSLKIEPLIISSQRKRMLNDHLMLFFTGFSRFSSEVAKSQVANINNKTTELHSMRAMVDQGVEILCESGDIRLFGELLHSGWMYKRSMSDQVSNSSIDNLYDKARNAGAIGGKLLGAGGGGFMLMFVEPDKQVAVRQALADLIHVPFKFEMAGSQVIHYEP